MTELQLVVAAGLFSLGGVVLGALLMPLTQLYLERKRDKRASDRARLVVAGELLTAQLRLRVASRGRHWLQLHDVKAFLPLSAWRDNRASLAGYIEEDLYNQLTLAYAGLELDRLRFEAAYRMPGELVLPAEVAQDMKMVSNDLGRLRRRLGGGGGWLDEIDAQFEAWVARLNDDSQSSTPVTVTSPCPSE